MFKVPNNYRLRTHKILGSDDSYGNNGMFIVPFGAMMLNCMASDGQGWEHVSVTIDGGQQTPTWEIMCYVKDLFWDEDDCVIQYHPPKSVYVNNMKSCLHLWNPIGTEIPIPKPQLVGAV